jgi:ABC-type oligopeptide transport system substrate-binding subunit
MPLFQSRSEINRGNHRYASERLDKLLGEAEMERSLSRRTEFFRQMEQVLVEDLPALPIYSSEQRIALQPYVRGVKMPPLGFSYLDAKEIWLNKKEQQE